MSQKSCAATELLTFTSSFEKNSGFANFLWSTWTIIDTWNHSSRPTRGRGDLRRVLVTPKHLIEKWIIQLSTRCFVSMTLNIRVVSKYIHVWHHLDNTLRWFTFHPDILTSWKIYPNCHLIWGQYASIWWMRKQYMGTLGKEVKVQNLKHWVYKNNWISFFFLPYISFHNCKV